MCPASQTERSLTKHLPQDTTKHLWWMTLINCACVLCMSICPTYLQALRRLWHYIVIQSACEAGTMLPTCGAIYWIKGTLHHLVNEVDTTPSNEGTFEKCHCGGLFCVGKGGLVNDNFLTLTEHEYAYYILRDFTRITDTLLHKTNLM